MKKNVYEMTVRELVESGANLNIFYHSAGTEKIAENVIGEFEKISEPAYEKPDDENNNTRWIDMRDDGVRVVAFYEEDKQ